MYPLIRRESWKNYPQFFVENTDIASLLPGLLFMITTFVVTGVFSLFLIIAGTDSDPNLRFYLIAGVALFFLAAVISYVITYHTSKKIRDEIQHDIEHKVKRAKNNLTIG